MAKQKIIKYILIFPTLIFSFLAWYSIDRAVNVSDSSSLLMPAVWFSILFIFISLDIILIREIHILEIVFFAGFLLSFIFFFNFLHFAFIFLALIFLYLSIVKMKKEMKLNIKISLGKIISSGRSFLIFSLAIMISSQYYFEIKDFSLEKMIPKFEMGKSSSYMTSKIMSFMNPNFTDVDSNNMTIDEFIREMQSKQFENMSQDESDKLDEIITQQVGENITPEQKEAIRREAMQKLTEKRIEAETGNQAVLEGRKNLSQMVGFELKGDEKANDVFTQIINKKVAERIQETFSKKVLAFPIILAILLFFTILSLGSILNLIYVPSIALLFYILKKTEFIVIKKVPTEQEIIE